MLVVRVLFGSASTCFSCRERFRILLRIRRVLRRLQRLRRVLADLGLALSAFSSAARATGLVSPAPRRIALAAAAASILAVSFMLVPELRGVHEPDLLHVIALGSRQHNRDLAILGPAIGTQVNLRLRVLATTLNADTSPEQKGCSPPVPFHTTAPSKSTSRSMTSGRTVGGGALLGIGHVQTSPRAS